MASVEILDVVYYDSIVRGHHIYKTIWTPFIGEMMIFDIFDIRIKTNDIFEQ